MTKGRKWQVQQKYPIDRCPKCKTLLGKKQFEILWRDVAECKYCGHIWVLENLDIIKYL